jgi:hypothetical protein
MTPKTDKGLGLLAWTPALLGRLNLDCRTQVVISDPVGNAAKVFEGAEVGRQEAFLSL